MASRWKKLTPENTPVNELGPNGECYHCYKKHKTWYGANNCYAFEDNYFGFDKDFNCLYDILPEDFKKFSPYEESNSVNSFLMLGYLGYKLVKYVEFHRTHDEQYAFGNYSSHGTDEFFDKVKSITSKAFQKVKDSLGALPDLPKDIKTKMSILDKPFDAVEGYDLTVLTEISVFEDHSDEDIKELRSIHKTLAEIYSDVQGLGHFTYCRHHGTAIKVQYEDDRIDGWNLEEKMCEFELPDYRK